MKPSIKRRKGPAPRPANDNSNFRDRLQASRLRWREAVYGAVAWGAAMSLSAQASLWISNAGQTAQYWSLAALMFFGAVLAWPFALAAFRFIAFGRAREAAFATAFLCLTIFTIGATAATFAVIYRSFYAQWHDEMFTTMWLIQLVFTTASALYQFAVIGLRLYLPLGVAFLFAAAFVLARHHGRVKPPSRRIIP